jgi:hypothetical protein
MAIDASIYFQQQPLDVMGNYQRGLAVRDQLDERARQQRQQAEQDQIREAFGAGMQVGDDGQVSFDQQKTIGQIAQVDPMQAYQAQQQFQQQDFQNQQQQMQLDEGKAKKTLQDIDMWSRVFGSVGSQEELDQALRVSESLGMDTTNAPRAYDEGLFRQYKMRALSAKEQLEQQMREHQMKMSERQQSLAERKDSRDAHAERMQAMSPEARFGGKLERGHRWLPDGSQEPIPGTPAAREVEDRDRARSDRKATERRRGATVLRDARRSIERIDQNIMAAGAQAAVTKHIPGTSAWRLEQSLKSLRSSMSLEELQAVRDMSPTGGGVGQVPVRQQEMLSEASGILEVEMDPTDLKENVARVNNIWLDVMYGSEEEIIEAVAEGRMTEDDAKRAWAARMHDGWDGFGQRIEDELGVEQRERRAPRQGPKEGDTKTYEGIRYKVINGQWVPQ